MYNNTTSVRQSDVQESVPQAGGKTPSRLHSNRRSENTKTL